MGKGLGERQKRLLDWICEQVEQLADGQSYSNGWWTYWAPDGATAEDLGLPRYRLANIYAGRDATAAELEATRRALRTLQDRNLLAEHQVSLAMPNLSPLLDETGIEQEMARSRRYPSRVDCYCLQPAGAEPVERWKPDPNRISIASIYRDAIHAHVDSTPRDWLELEPVILETVKRLAVERFGQEAAVLASPRHRYRLIAQRRYLASKGRLVVTPLPIDYSQQDAANPRMPCTISRR